MSEIQIGIIGIGSMGSGMARRLLESGVKVSVVDRNATAVATLEAEGATAAGSAQDDFWR